MRRLALPLLVALAALGAPVACAPPVSPDAGVDAGNDNDDDAGANDDDAGTNAGDAGTTDADAGTPNTDAGTNITDAGTPNTDAGTPNTDAGTNDAGHVTADAGTIVDAGNAPDAGHTVDAGSSTDAGNVVDAGNAPAGDAGFTVDAGAQETPGEELVRLINEYRVENGKPAVPRSPSLMLVAATHVQDLVDNDPVSGQCNLHSWSDQGDWTACCYTADHAQAQCMWDKPRELTDFTGNGYENSASGVGTAAGALAIWKNSPAHNDVLLSQGIWASFPFQAVGAALGGGYAVVWFSEGAEP